MSLEEKEKELYEMTHGGDENIIDMRANQQINNRQSEKTLELEEEVKSSWDKETKTFDYQEGKASIIIEKLGFFSKIIFWVIIFIIL
jgi:hypothetical protein